tara:strand:- start:1747 stop:2169 length:423 start_codon:yes stop_codon:yes gene_type:complete
MDEWFVVGRRTGQEMESRYLYLVNVPNYLSPFASTLTENLRALRFPFDRKASPGFAVHVVHDVVDPSGVLVDCIQFDEVVEPALVKGTVALEGVDPFQALFVGNLEDFALDLVAVRGMAVAKKGEVGHDQFAQLFGLGSA